MKKEEFKLPKDIVKMCKKWENERKAHEKKMKRKPYWKKLGVVGVDSGQLVVCDPCYINGDFGKKINKFVENRPDHTQYNYEAGHPGLAVSFSSGYGDGEYEIVGKIEKCRIVEVRIKMK